MRAANVRRPYGERYSAVGFVSAARHAQERHGGEVRGA